MNSVIRGENGQNKYERKINVPKREIEIRGSGAVHSKKPGVNMRQEVEPVSVQLIALVAGVLYLLAHG